MSSAIQGCTLDHQKYEQKVGMIVTELAQNGALFEYISHCGCLSEELTHTYGLQLLSAIQHIHSNEIAHLDIKLENLLLDQDFRLKVADFGLAKPISASNGNGFENRQYGGTKAFMAPEIHLKLSYSPIGADLFALGVVLFAMRVGTMPFTQAT